MMNESDRRELRRMLAEPPSGERRDCRLPAEALIAAMIDTPYYPPYAVDVLHCHNTLELGVCVTGCGRIRTRTSEWTFSPGAVLLTPREVLHSQQNEGVLMTRWRYIEVYEDMLLYLAGERRLCAIRTLIESAGGGMFLPGGQSGEIPQLVQMMFDTKRCGGEESLPELSLFLLLILLLMARHADDVALSISADAPGLAPVEPALVYVSQNYTHEIRVSDMARSCAMSESYFRKLFARLMGMPPLEYVNRYRIHRALNLLRLTQEPIQNIAARCGFFSLAAFNRNFKRYVGKSPSDWRNGRQNQENGR